MVERIGYQWQQKTGVYKASFLGNLVMGIINVNEFNCWDIWMIARTHNGLRPSKSASRCDKEETNQDSTGSIQRCNWTWKTFICKYSLFRLFCFIQNEERSWYIYAYLHTHGKRSEWFSSCDTCSIYTHTIFMEFKLVWFVYTVVYDINVCMQDVYLKIMFPLCAAVAPSSPFLSLSFRLSPLSVFLLKSLFTIICNLFLVLLSDQSMYIDANRVCVYVGIYVNAYVQRSHPCLCLCLCQCMCVFPRVNDQWDRAALHVAIYTTPCVMGIFRDKRRCRCWCWEWCWVINMFTWWSMD